MDIQKNKEVGFRIRMTEEEKNKIKNNCLKYGFRSMGEFLRFVGINCKIKVKSDEEIKN